MTDVESVGAIVTGSGVVTTGLPITRRPDTDPFAARSPWGS